MNCLLTEEEKENWLSERVWCLSANNVLDNHGRSATTLAHQVYRPRSAQEIAHLIQSFPSLPISCVCGGHESSNVAALASKDALLLDLVNFKAIVFHDHDSMEVTVGAGVLFQELVEAVKDHHGALPVGTGPTVGVIGFLVNGGLSGYFSRRLGLLGQRVTKMTIVTASGDVRVLTPANELFTCMLGAGSALGVVVDVTLRMEAESAIQCAEQRVVAFQNREQAVSFSRGALEIMKDHVLPNPSVSMELVVSGSNALVATFIFYDSFQGNTFELTKAVEDLAASYCLPVVAESQWTTWYQAAAALWPVIAEMKGNPLVTLQHCVGTKGIPDDEILDFVSHTIVGELPLDEAELSLVEIRTLGGAIDSGAKLPTGVCHHQFFAGIITLYDAENKSITDRQRIAARTNCVVNRAREVEGLTVDFSGTTSQPDDAEYTVTAPDMFGSSDMVAAVIAMKAKEDPNNRLRFHPFAKLFPKEHFQINPESGRLYSTQ